MDNQERWNIFIRELREYIEVHHLGPRKHTSLRNQLVYYRRKMRDGELDPSKAEELEAVLGMRDLSIHTGGRKPKASGNEESRNLLSEFRKLDT